MAAGGLKALTEVLQLIGGATLAVQTVVLGASLFQKAKRQQPRAPNQAASGDLSAGASSSGRQSGGDPRIKSLSPTGETSRERGCMSLMDQSLEVGACEVASFLF